jgi:hypothetical protein
MFLYYKTHRLFPLEGRGGKRANKSYLDTENVFATCRTWLLAQKLAIITPNTFRHAINTDIIPRLLVNAKKPLIDKTRPWILLSRAVTYNWL